MLSSVSINDLIKVFINTLTKVFINALIKIFINALTKIFINGQVLPSVDKDCVCIWCSFCSCWAIQSYIMLISFLLSARQQFPLFTNRVPIFILILRSNIIQDLTASPCGKYLKTSASLADEGSTDLDAISTEVCQRLQTLHIARFQEKPSNSAWQWWNSTTCCTCHGSCSSTVACMLFWRPSVHGFNFT